MVKTGTRFSSAPSSNLIPECGRMHGKSTGHSGNASEVTRATISKARFQHCVYPKLPLDDNIVISIKKNNSDSSLVIHVTEESLTAGLSTEFLW